MDLVDSKYIGLVSSRLPKFKRVKANLYNFRCPICGDSQKHKNKARGYLYPIKVNTNFKCHNCGASMSFNNFLKEIDPTLFYLRTLRKIQLSRELRFCKCKLRFFYNKVSSTSMSLLKFLHSILLLESRIYLL